jgi:hypothetical protein
METNPVLDKVQKPSNPKYNVPSLKPFGTGLDVVKALVRCLSGERKVTQ